MLLQRSERLFLTEVGRMCVCTSLLLLAADLPISAALVASRVSAAIGGAAPAPSFAQGPVSYMNHGVDWQEGSCKSRARQSPISLDTNLKDLPEDFFKYRYDPISDPALKLNAVNGALSIDVGGLGFGGVEFQQVPYELVRVDVRGPSEHLVEGERQPLELQMVHREASVGSGHHDLIISVLVWCEHAPRSNDTVAEGEEYSVPGADEADFNVDLQPLLGERPPGAQGGSVDLSAISAGSPLDLGRLLEDPQAPADERGRFVAYAGSETQPPCKEHVTWLVRRSPLMASDSQVKAFADALFALTDRAGSFRSVMPLNQRSLRIVGPKYDATLVLSGRDSGDRHSGGSLRGTKPWLPLGPNPRTDDELRALRYAEAARVETRKAQADASKLFGRLHTAEKAYVKTLERSDETAEAGRVVEAGNPWHVAMGGVAAAIRREATTQNAAAARMVPTNASFAPAPATAVAG